MHIINQSKWVHQEILYNFLQYELICLVLDSHNKSCTEKICFTVYGTYQGRAYNFLSQSFIADIQDVIEPMFTFVLAWALGSAMQV